MSAIQSDSAQTKAEWGLLAEYATPYDLAHAAEKVRDAGYKKWDVYCPFPVHDMNESMGIGQSKVGWIVICGAVFGSVGGMFLQYFLSAVVYDVPIGGKPFWAWEQFTPITFELGVLFSAFCAIFGMFALNGLPRFHHPLFGVERFLRVSDDKFFICVETADRNYDADATRRLLEEAGAVAIETVED